MRGLGGACAPPGPSLSLNFIASLTCNANSKCLLNILEEENLEKEELEDEKLEEASLEKAKLEEGKLEEENL